jgi:nitroimidazol reductase NimA-like FMN-containing flavoprotein (pyridoxamine 5'-phosphate oxidase superfamily)
MRRSDREIRDPGEIEDIFRKADVCRVAFADNNFPYIVTMNFGYSAGEKWVIYFHCARKGMKLEMLAKNDRVCFELDVDHELYSGEKACDTGMRYRSVVGWGKIGIVKDENEITHGLDLIMSHYSGNGNNVYDKALLEKVIILRLDISEMTGKKCH